MSISFAIIFMIFLGSGRMLAAVVDCGGEYKLDHNGKVSGLNCNDTSAVESALASDTLTEQRKFETTATADCAARGKGCTLVLVEKSITDVACLSGTLKYKLHLKYACQRSTAITLLSFNATALNNGNVFLAWETATEIDNAGFNLYRARTKDGTYKKINDTLIPAQGNATTGASYSFVDTPPSKGTYYYKLEDVDYNGVCTMHGPEKVRVKSGDNATRRW